MTDGALVTVLIPARNEEADIERCLRAVLAQDHPHDRMEIVLVDGGSTDATATVARSVLASGDIPWKIVDNPVGTTPSNLNAGLAVASGEYLCRVDARSIIPVEYVRLCAELLADRSDVVVTGGAQVAVTGSPRTDSAVAAGIARALNNRFTMGGARYRSGAAAGPSDTVYLGAFRTSDLLAADGWNVTFATNQDYELNRRLGQRGVVWFDDRLQVAYIPRRTLRGLWTQYHRFGCWKSVYWRETGDRPQLRQVVPLAGAMTVGVGVVVLLASFPVRGVLTGGAVTSAAALLAVDRLGSPIAERATERVVGAAAIGVVGVAWATGVARGALRPWPLGER